MRPLRPPPPSPRAAAEAALALAEHDPTHPLVRLAESIFAIAEEMRHVEAEALFADHRGLPVGVAENLVAERFRVTSRTIRRWIRGL